MPMYPVVVEGILGLVIAWLLVLSLVWWKQWRRSTKLLPKGSDKHTLEDRLVEIAQQMSDLQGREKVIFKTLRELADDGMRAISKVAIERYNPYNEVGGSISFSIVLLDGSGNGMIITSLHSRAGTRMYAKEVSEGKSSTRLSSEEERVLKKALSER